MGKCTGPAVRETEKTWFPGKSPPGNRAEQEPLAPDRS
jgi:hypothetical protein